MSWIVVCLTVFSLQSAPADLVIDNARIWSDGLVGFAEFAESIEVAVTLRAAADMIDSGYVRVALEDATGELSKWRLVLLDGDDPG